MIEDFNALVGMRVQDALKMLESENVKAKVTDFSRPDKYHKDVPQSLRVVKITVCDGEVEILAAGFVDEIENTHN